MKFKVLDDFQMGGINFEEGNTHTKHGLSDAQVVTLHNAGFVHADELAGPEKLLVATEVKPDDLIINFKAE